MTATFDLMQTKYKRRVIGTIGGGPAKKRSEELAIRLIGERRSALHEYRLRERGIAEENIRRVHTPIGIAIKYLTPEEIAFSIAGEMIHERALRREAAGEVTHACPMH